MGEPHLHAPCALTVKASPGRGARILTLGSRVVRPLGARKTGTGQRPCSQNLKGEAVMAVSAA